jgi:hypothetical protein
LSLDASFNPPGFSRVSIAAMFDSARRVHYLRRFPSETLFDGEAMKSLLRFALCAGLLAAGFALYGSAVFAAPAADAIPTPEQFFGFKIGADKKLARWDKIVEYLTKIAGSSDRVRIHTLGPSTNGNPFVMLEISSADNIKNLDHLKSLERKLYFQGGAPTDAERDQIFREGKAVVFISNNIHSTEIGASQMVIEAVYKLATDDSPDTKNILDNVVLVLIPSLNPDGQIMVTDWYNKYVGTPQEGGPMPYVYHPYVGHDNNRDMFLFSQKESQMTAQALWHDWFPAIWLDEHQQGSNGPRIFTMPATDPINPNVHPLVYRLNTIYGQAQAAALEAEGKEGIIFNATYTNFWEGAMAWAGWWHNEVGLLTEVASARIATPITQTKADPNRPPAGAGAQIGRTGPAGPIEGGGGGGFGQDRGPTAPLPPPTDILPRTEYPRPWLGGTWHLSDIVDYEMTATFALLRTAAQRRETLLHDIYDINANTIDLGKKGELGFEDKEKSFAAIIPVSGQHDANEVAELIDKLRMGGVEVSRATKEFKQDNETYPAGTYVISFNQVFSRYAKDMLEKQTYPEVRRAPGAPAEAPYDVSAWSLGMQFGVKTVFARTALPADLALEPVGATPKFTVAADGANGKWSFTYAGAESAIVVNRLLKEGANLTIAKPRGAAAPTIRVNAKPDVWNRAVAGFDVTRGSSSGASANSASAAATVPMHAPRIAMYQSWTANMDEGWTRWVLEHYEFPYKTLHNADLQAGKLRDSFDAIIVPDQAENSIVEGQTSEFMVAEYRGGIGEKGWQALKEFANAGGTLVAMGGAASLLIDRLPLPVKELKRTLNRDQQYAPGAIVSLQVDTTHPIGYGMAADTYGFYINSPFFELTEGFSSQKVSVVARYPNVNVNASGWLRGEEYMQGRAAVVAIEMNPGKIVLFGIRPQHRAQTHATFPMLFNALYWSTEGDVAGAEK